MKKLKKAFDASRAFKGHSLEDACEELDVSRTFLNMFFKEYATSAPLKKKIKKYIYEAGLVRTIKELGLNEEPSASKVVN